MTRRVRVMRACVADVRRRMTLIDRDRTDRVLNRHWIHRRAQPVVPSATREFRTPTRRSASQLLKVTRSVTNVYSPLFRDEPNKPKKKTTNGFFFVPDKRTTMYCVLRHKCNIALVKYFNTDILLVIRHYTCTFGRQNAATHQVCLLRNNHMTNIRFFLFLSP